jgi:hypothetical protein
MDVSSKQPKRAEVSAVIIRADGSREELGIVSYWHRNPLMRLWYRFVKRVKGKVTV